MNDRNKSRDQASSQFQFLVVKVVAFPPLPVAPQPVKVRARPIVGGDLRGGVRENDFFSRLLVGNV